MMRWIVSCAAMALLLAGCNEGGMGGSSKPAADGSAATTPAEKPEAAKATPTETATSDEVSLASIDVAGLAKAVEAQQGKVVLVDFWATWCIPCRQEFPHVMEIGKKYADNGLVVISVSMDDPESAREEALEFLKKEGAKIPNYISSLGVGEEAMEAFDVDGGSLPHIKIYGRDGKLLKKFGGDPIDNPFDHTDLEKAVAEAIGDAT